MEPNRNQPEHEAHPESAPIHTDGQADIAFSFPMAARAKHRRSLKVTLLVVLVAVLGIVSFLPMLRDLRTILTPRCDTSAKVMSARSEEMGRELQSLSSLVNAPGATKVISPLQDLGGDCFDSMPTIGRELAISSLSMNTKTAYSNLDRQLSLRGYTRLEDSEEDPCNSTYYSKKEYRLLLKFQCGSYNPHLNYHEDRNAWQSTSVSSVYINLSVELGPSS